MGKHTHLDRGREDLSSAGLDEAQLLMRGPPATALQQLCRGGWAGLLAACLHPISVLMRMLYV